MNPEAFAQIEQLYHTLLPLEPEQRHARLAAVSDAQLRREVERLLAANEQTGTLIQSPAVVVPDAHEATPRGRTLGHYRLQSLLGKGGMGEVYLAEDTQLERQVAIKLLPATFTTDTDRVRRFTREAKAASALNHPNILTIHEIGHEQNTHYIATEYIAGKTLCQHLTQRRLPLRAALDIAAQIASALVAAHTAGIIHRDIKPENVMLREDGLVKVLDFGLAKLLENRHGDTATQRPSEDDPTLLAEPPRPPVAVSHSTEPGTVMGTASYMSPEQARGQEVDARSDIFSLGVVLYEMLAGRAPFAGVNPIDVLGAILHQEPASLVPYVADIPNELQRIVNKALRKDRDERYQHSKELWLDLNDLRRELEFEEKLKARQSPPTETREQAKQEPSSEVLDAQPPAGATAQPTVSSAEYLIGELKQHKKGVAIGAAVLLAGLALLTYGLYRFTASTPTAAPFQKVKLTRLTSVGNVDGLSVSVSPDGKFIAYAQTEAGQNSLWTKAVATGSAVQLVPPTENRLANTTFSPDGNYVYYQRQEEQTSLYQIPVLGGTSKKILTGIDSINTFSPDDKQFAFTRTNADKTKSQLMVVNADGSGERMLAERPSNEEFRSLSWSPDGKTIAAIAFSRAGEIRQPLLLSIAVENGKEQAIVQPQQSLGGFNQISWFKDGKGLALIATEQDGSNYQIWYLSYPGGEVRRITNDLANYPRLSLTADNSSLVAAPSDSYSHLWIMPLNATGRAQQITKERVKNNL